MEEIVAAVLVGEVNGYRIQFGQYPWALATRSMRQRAIFPACSSGGYSWRSVHRGRWTIEVAGWR